MAFPILRRIGGFFASYARKATVSGGVGTAVTTAILGSLSLPEGATDSLIGWMQGLPIWVQVPAFFAIFFAVTYYPPNGAKPE